MQLKKLFSRFGSLNPASEGPLLIEPCVRGDVIPLSEVKDEVFSTGMMGKGFAVVPREGKITAPVSGTVEMVFPTGHAIGLKADNGAEVLIHIGINTVELNGKGFSCHVKKGERIRKGALLESVDLDVIRQGDYDPTTMIIITNSDNFKSIEWNGSALAIAA